MIEDPSFLIKELSCIFQVNKERIHDVVYAIINNPDRFKNWKETWKDNKKQYKEFLKNHHKIEQEWKIIEEHLNPIELEEGPFGEYTNSLTIEKRISVDKKHLEEFEQVFTYPFILMPTDTTPIIKSSTALLKDRLLGTYGPGNETPITLYKAYIIIGIPYNRFEIPTERKHKFMAEFETIDIQDCTMYNTIYKSVESILRERKKDNDEEDIY